MQGEDMVCTRCELLSLKTREWRYISHVPIPCFRMQVSASGYIYWFTAYLWESSEIPKIIAFDLHTHRFCAVHHPHFGARQPSKRIQILNIRDQVWIAEQTPDCLEMWSMDRGGDAWGKTYSIDLASCGRSSMEKFTPIEIYKDGMVLIRGKEPYDLEERLLKYDPRTKTLQTFIGHVPFYQTRVLATYFESLFSFSTLYY